MSAAPPSPEEFRGYLTAVARMQVAARPWLAAKLDASDLVQQTLLQAHAARDQHRGTTPAEMGGWLRRILTHTLANALRALGQGKRDVGKERSIEADLDASHGRLDAWLAVDQTSPSGRLDEADRAERLAAAVAQLPEDQRQAVLGKHVHGLTVAEIAGQMGKSPAAVAGLLRRGLERLRELMPEGADAGR